jgi:tRNA (cmo5U34)-methyltransferase
MFESNRFDQAAATWDELPRRVELARGVADEIVRRIVLTPDLDLLDFGCGTGLLTLALAPLVRTATGFDTSAGMLEVLAGKAQAQGRGNVRTVLLDAGSDALPALRFHAVVSSMTLHHVADLPPLLRRFHELLLPGGRIALADLDREDGSFHQDNPADVHHLGFDRAELMALLAAAGFRELAATTAFVTRKLGRDYPVFLVTGQRDDEQTSG